MRIDFRRLEIHSFMSFEDETFDFDAHSGMTLIRGKNDDLPNNETNGSGKTAVFSALTYALFGEVQSRVKHNENIVNRFAPDKDMRLVLTLDVDDTGYRIVRGLNKGKSSYLELYRGGENITKSSIAETQDFIEKEVLACDMPIFLRTVFLTSNQTYNFYDLKKSDKKEFVEKLFDIAVFGDMYQAMHRDVLDQEKQMLAIQSKLIMLNKQEHDYQERMRRHDSEKAGKLDEIDKRIADVERQRSELRSRDIKLNTDEISKLEAAADKIGDAKLSLNESIRLLDAKNYKIDAAIHKLTASEEAKRAVIDKHSEIMKRLCDDCREVFSEYYGISRIMSDIGELQKKSGELLVSRKANADEKTSLSQKFGMLDEKLDLVNSRIRQATEEYNKASRTLTALDQRADYLRQDKDRLENSDNPYVSLYEENRRNIDDETSMLDKLEKSHRYLKFAEGIVSQETLRKFIISDLIGLLNNKIKTYLTRLGAKYTVVFDSDMDYEFVTSGGPCEFGNFSMGEAKRIMIATSFAFRDFMSIRNGLTSNILVLDEYFDSALSASCVESIIQILKEYVRDYKQGVYCISHRTEVSVENFDSVILVHKTNDISRIEYPGKAG